MVNRNTARKSGMGRKKKEVLWQVNCATLSYRFWIRNTVQWSGKMVLTVAQSTLMRRTAPPDNSVAVSRKCSTMFSWSQASASQKIRSALKGHWGWAQLEEIRFSQHFKDFAQGPRRSEPQRGTKRAINSAFQLCFHSFVHIICHWGIITTWQEGACFE